MESIKTINSPKKTSDKKNNKKKNKTEIKIEKPILSFSFNYDSIV